MTTARMEKQFAALADGNRRKVIELLAERDSTLLELSEQFPISFQALSKHIKILEAAEIVSKEQQGKYKVLSLNRTALRIPLAWMAQYSDFWNASFDKLNKLIDGHEIHGKDD